MKVNTVRKCSAHSKNLYMWVFAITWNFVLQVQEVEDDLHSHESIVACLYLVKHEFFFTWLNLFFYIFVFKSSKTGYSSPLQTQFVRTFGSLGVSLSLTVQENIVFLLPDF